MYDKRMLFRSALHSPRFSDPPQLWLFCKSAANRSINARHFCIARLVLSAGLACLLCRPSQARQNAAAPLSQRGINEMAASVEQARRTLLDDAHLRRPGEDLSAYLRRVALPLPAETKPQYFTRVGAYVTALEQSAGGTRTGRRMPALRDADAFNQEQWTRAVRALQILPARVLKTQAAWRRVQASYDPAAPDGLQGAQMQFAAQMEQTVQVVIASDDALHNAKP